MEGSGNLRRNTQGEEGGAEIREQSQGGGFDPEHMRQDSAPPSEEGGPGAC